MNRLKTPYVWLPLALAPLAALGALALNTRACKSLDERDWTGYGRMNAWQSAFDACSAVCGVGWLTYDVDDEYTALGRWVLTGLGVAGAALFLAAAAAASRRLWAACDARGHFPPARWIVAAFGVVLAAGALAAGLLERVAGRTDWDGAACRAVSAVASLGWFPGAPPRGQAWIYAALALAGALGWSIWLLPFVAGRWRLARLRRVLGLVAAYFLFLGALALVVWALEAPRGGRVVTPRDEMLTGQPSRARYARALLQVVCASTAGIPTENLGELNVTDGTKLVLTLAVLVGPLGGAAGGGVKWTLLLAAAGGGLAAFTRGHCGRHAAALRGLLAGTGCLTLLTLLTLVTALGLMAIETRTASAYQVPPTFADALLDASSAVGGANLTSGVVRAVTHRNLSRGIRQDVDLYQYGMVWLMAAMLLGRVLPLFVLCRVAALRLTDEPGPPPPLV